MTIQAVTVTEGANATLPGGTNAALMPSSAGYIVGVVPAYAPTSGDAPTPLADENGVFMQGETTITDLTVASTNTPVHIGDETSSTELIAANGNRKGWTIQNNSSSPMRVKLGTGASTSSFHRLLRQYESMGQRIMDGDLYTGAIHGIWESNASGFADGGDW